MPDDAFAPYRDGLDDGRRGAFDALVGAIRGGIPPGFTEGVQYQMPSWFVAHADYPSGYHCDPKQPLPFLSLVVRPGKATIYHMGVYADPTLLAWLQAEYPRHAKGRLDMGKSCIHLKRLDALPLDLVRALAGKMSAAEWIAWYERNLRR